MDIREELSALLYEEHIEGPYIDQYEDFITWADLDEEHKNLFRAEADALMPLVARIQAEAWDEGHKTRWRRGPDGCLCGAWSSNECACGLYGTGELVSLKLNPYRADRQENP